MSSDRVSIGDDCITAFSELRSQRHSNKPRYIIYRITEDYNNVVVEDSSFEKDYEVFRQKLVSAIDSEGRPAPRYAVYDVEYDLGSEGKRTKIVFITWVPGETSVKDRMIYASTKEQLRKFLDVKASIHADDLDELEWKTVLKEVSGGKA
ncbi:Actin-binding cofilin/tropomyosin type [Penicillium brevicompactum]|uniref:Actin-binding cofilin/tropomyosin type n=1 Tax=Penicillium brevicompactum TaxID=5074 RepID=UPI002541CD9C|nr:Actin-binding cofilin/tropomyosin type [Penicillium brevicompactum]KAJ5326383.1 Actin-binding cofilin/tropomyosin type [Penicillium brevicompactum]